MGKKRVLSIGFDGATFDLIDPWMEAGYLPNIKKVLSQGVRASLRSVILPFSAQAWASFMTGVNPGNHGIFGFKEKVQGDYSFQLVNNRSLRAKTLWKFLGDMGKRTVAINIPMTYPPEEVNGILIGGMDSPGLGSNFTYPPEAKDELLKAARDYIIHLHVGAGYLDNDEKRRKAVTGLVNMIDAREKAVHHFMKTYDWDLFAVNFSATDQVQHHFWKYLGYENEFKDAVRTVYERVDQALGKILEEIDDETFLFVMSDHGAGAASEKVIFIDEWLRQQGLLRFKEVSPFRKLKRRATGWLLDNLSKKLSSGAKDALMRRLPGLRAKSQGFLRRSLIDWNATQVYSGEHPATLRLNLKGRERQGVVSDADYEVLRNRVVRELEALQDPVTGDKMIDKVYKKEEIYHGRFLDSAPDLIIWPHDFSHQVKGGPFPKQRSYQGIVSQKDSRDFYVNGTHRLHGIFMAKGKGIQRNISIPDVEITDLFPTFLYCLGVDVPKSVDGKVISALFQQGVVDQKPVRYTEDHPETESRSEQTSTYDATDETDEIEQTLKGLGYMD